jgi:hypothetical protein
LPRRTELGLVPHRYHRDVSGGAGQLLCIALALAAVVGGIRLRQRVGRLTGLPSVPGARRRGGGEHDANPREFDGDDGGDDGDGDGGDA